MSRAEYMRQLESLLQNITPSERESALEYYNDYFDDAGEENEQEVIKALGTPAKVAQSIKEELLGKGYGENMEWKVSAEDRAVMKYGNREHTNAYSAPEEHTVQEEGKKLSGGVIALIVILCIFAAPFLLTAVTGLASLIFGIAAMWFGIILGFGIAAVILLAVMLALLVTGIIGCLISPIGALGLLGAALVCGGFGLLFLFVTVWMAGMATPAVFRGTVWLFRKLFGRKQDAGTARA